MSLSTEPSYHTPSIIVLTACLLSNLIFSVVKVIESQQKFLLMGAGAAAQG